MDCVLHIGIGKAGSSSIQGALEANRALLGRRGILYPRDLMPSGRAGGDNHKCLAVSCMRPGRVNVVLQQHRVASAAARTRFDAQVETLYRDQLASFDGNLCLLSAEHFWSCLPHPDEMAALAGKLAALGLRTRRLVVYLRRQSEWFESFLHQRIREGRGLLELGAEALLASPSARQIDYAALLEDWAAAFPGTEIVPRVFAREAMAGGDIVADLCAAAGIDPVGQPSGPRNASSVSNTGVNLMLAMRRSFELPGAPPFDTRAWRRLTACIEESFPGRCTLLPEAERRAIDRFYEAGNEAVRQRHFPERGTLFPEPRPVDDGDAFHELAGADFRQLADFSFALWRRAELAPA